MTTEQQLQAVVRELPEERVRELLRFAEFLAARAQDDEWHDAARRRFAESYADDEPEYSMSDVIRT